MDIVGHLAKLEDVADTIIFDTGAGLSEHAMRLTRAAHETILVITPEPTSMVDAYALLKMLLDQGERPHVSLVVNKVTGAREAATVAQGFTRIAEKNLCVHIHSLGHITRDMSMSNAIKMQVPILISYPKCAAAADICLLAQRYLGQPPNMTKRPGVIGFLEYFLTKKNAGRES
jgi:flagellar biosynthesis protein FlhG